MIGILVTNILLSKSSFFGQFSRDIFIIGLVAFHCSFLFDVSLVIKLFFFCAMNTSFYCRGRQWNSIE